MHFYRIIAVISALVMLISGCSTIGQPLDNVNTSAPTPVTDTEYTARNVGSAKKLEGSCFIVNVFLSDDDSSWTYEEKHGALLYLETAIEFLKKQAEGYGKELTVSYTDEAGSAQISVDGEIPDGASGMNQLFSMMEKAGMSDKQLEEKSCFEDMLTLYDNVFFLFFVNKQGRSYSAMYDSKYSDCQEYFSERAVLFYNTDRSYKYCANVAVYAHEILHLFGAVDMYEGSAYEEKGKLYENDIMNKTPFDMKDISIGEFTAFHVGLSDAIAKAGGTQ